MSQNPRAATLAASFQSTVARLRDEHGGARRRLEQTIRNIKLDRSATNKKLFLAELNLKLKALATELPAVIEAQNKLEPVSIGINLPAELHQHTSAAYSTALVSRMSQGAVVGTLKQARVPIPADVIAYQKRRGIAITERFRKAVVPGFVVSYEDMRGLSGFKQLCDLLEAADVHLDIKDDKGSFQTGFLKFMREGNHGGYGPMTRLIFTVDPSRRYDNKLYTPTMPVEYDIEARRAKLARVFG